MAKPPERDLIMMIIRNFINSLKPKYLRRGTLVGSDYLGNKYFEIPANPSEGKRKASRWFEPKEREKFDQEMPAEWEAWLRGRRADVPHESEIMKNLAIMRMKKHNAVAIEANAGAKTPMVKGVETFPSRPDYEITPGKAKTE